MSAVRDVLPNICGLIERYHGRGITETHTRTNLINPILTALGWDLGDLNQVDFEYRYRGGNPVDYALLDQGKPYLFVEAKALGTNLSDHKWAGQIMGYAGVAGVEWVVLTDGNEYRIYSTHASADIDQKLFRTFRLTDVDDSSVTEGLELLARDGLREKRLERHWRVKFVDRQVQEALKALFVPEPDTSLVNVLQRRTNNLTRRDVSSSLRRVRARFEFPQVYGSSPDVSPPPVKPPPPPKPTTTGNAVQRLIAAKIIQPPFGLHRTYLGQTLSARIETDGSIVFQEERFRSVSMAGQAARIAAGFSGKNSNTNGWDFWRFIDADGQVKKIDVLRKRLEARGEPEGS